MAFQLVAYKLELEEFITYNNFEHYSILVKESNLSCFIYYLDFKLLLCSHCNSAINKENLKEYISKHLNNYKDQIKANKAISLSALISSLDIESLFNSLNLILNF